MKKKAQTGGLVIGLVIAALVIYTLGAVFGVFPAPKLGNIGDTEGPWDEKLVDFTVITTDRFAGSDESATVKVYDDKPEDWDNPRGDFSDAALYTSYTASSGVVTINKEYPGHYYLVGTVSGSNTEFLEIDIPNGDGLGELYDYNQEPDGDIMDFSAVGSSTDEDYAFTLTNGTDQTVKDTISLTLDDDTELRGWKVIVTDTEGFSIDANGDGTYDEGIKKYEVIVCGISKIIFEPAKGTDLFDSNDEYTFEIQSCKVQDGDDLNVKVEIKANTGDYTGANDEVWGEGEGVLSYVKVYDKEGNLFSTTDVTA
ncbi:hypothetical protein K8R33_02895 [archaeon]|nr:hypothetical protein [archaeon]